MMVRKPPSTVPRCARQPRTTATRSKGGALQPHSPVRAPPSYCTAPLSNSSGRPIAIKGFKSFDVGFLGTKLKTLITHVSEGMQEAQEYYFSCRTAKAARAGLTGLVVALIALGWGIQQDIESRLPTAGMMMLFRRTEADDEGITAPVSVHEAQDVARGKLSSRIHLAGAAALCAVDDHGARMLGQAHSPALKEWVA